MHTRAVIRGCLIACTLGVGGALVLILAAASALSPRLPEWDQVLLISFGVGIGAAVPLTGAALLGARYAAQRRATVPWRWGAVGGGAVAGLGGLLLSGGFGGAFRMAMVFAPFGVATGLLAWVAAFGFVPRVAFSPSDEGSK
ncbi:hypothetical protein JANAI62_21240 [Jannaschia pagri]|uniref:Major facilitator superfamily (MFS) profile domain-containing protein n=1 Tax=Jannaschia pagri TaxID=2829797 RepID=A0ABQ4NM67_9RHOB|nr:MULTISPECIES: hypothetical protein [unclassified Jannaschia]GIT91667.1 hypothetical protein JANAI61_21250 [Jannaschia sp. AI_61]GIT95501.1 hypothetical protein JANAI62_21240 [Jannaschia sp. AI_62]